MKKIIYDLGANNGDDIPYYLLKSDLVVAVEANPTLCQIINKRFQVEIEQGELVVENCVLTVEEDVSEVSFYIHKEDHVRSQFPKPPPEELINYEAVLLPSKSAIRIIEKYGEPYYIKIDIEHYDSEILQALYESNFFPPFISAETHDIKVFSLLVVMGYGAFKLVEGRAVSHVYSGCSIQHGQEKISYSFPYHSAGPFGNDIKGKWMNAENFLRLLAYEGLGWRDIHAARFEKADSSAMPSLIKYGKHLIKYKLMSYIPEALKVLIKDLARRFRVVFRAT